VPEKNKPEQLSDELIREALAREFESIEAPPVDECWSRVEAGLRGGRKPGQIRGFSWARYAAVAAAVLLVIALSSIGIMQMTEFASPMVEETPAEEAPMRTADEEVDALQVEEADAPEEEVSAPEVEEAEAPEAEVGILEVEEAEVPEEAEEVDISTEEVVVSALRPFEITVDPVPPEWQENLNDSLFFEEAVLLQAREGPDYQGAIYLGEEEVLLWVKSAVEQEEMGSFIENLGEHIEVESRPVKEDNGFIHFESAGQPGLAWREADQYQALVVVSGPVSADQLESITGDIE